MTGGIEYGFMSFATDRGRVAEETARKRREVEEAERKRREAEHVDGDRDDHEHADGDRDDHPARASLPPRRCKQRREAAGIRERRPRRSPAQQSVQAHTRAFLRDDGRG